MRRPLLLPLALLLVLASGARGQGVPLGLGLAEPTALSAETPLLFFGAPEAGAPLDSLTVREGPHHWGVASAPPWLSPDVAEIDGDRIAFRVVSLRRGWAEVAVHDRDIRWPPRTMWLPRQAVRVRPWAEVLLDAHHVAPLALTLLRPAPEANATGTVDAGTRLHVRAVRHGWLHVDRLEAPEADMGPIGWIRWHDGTRLLVQVSALE